MKGWYFMPIVDFHTHVFPDTIAKKTIASLAANSHNQPYGDGSFSSLLHNMQKSGVTDSVTLPVVTKPKQFQSILQFAVLCNQNPHIYAFGGIHPDDPEPEAHLRQIKEAGLYGVKLHPDYQQTMIDDAKYIRILKQCIALDLPVVIHAGLDEGLPDPIHCTPERTLHMLELVYGNTTPEKIHIILAHGGANRMHEQVLSLLCGKPVYFDLSYILSYIAPEQLLQIIRKHGAEKILFATDFPWSDPVAGVSFLKALPLTAAEQDAIFWKTASSILPISQM
jgi:predicted TIM-barrel fold metal-dependent hydrolase